jgi:hypothetical protein
MVDMESEAVLTIGAKDRTLKFGDIACRMATAVPGNGRRDAYAPDAHDSIAPTEPGETTGRSFPRR